MSIPAEQAQVLYPGAGSAGPFAVPFPYMDKAHVKVYLSDVPLVLTTDYTWPSAASIQLNVATNARVLIRRETPMATALVSIAAGTISPADINTLITQNLYVAQELADRLLGTASYAPGYPLGTLTQTEALVAPGKILSINDLGTKVEATLSRGNVEAAVAGYLNGAIPAVATAAYAVSLAAAKALFAAPVVLVSGLALTVAGRTAVYDGYQGTFIYTSADVVSVFTSDALGFVDNAGRRWKRVLPGFINAQWFGAKGDGVTDDYATLQACFTTAVGQNQANVYVPRGTYMLSQTLNISNVGLQGDGAVATTFKPSQPFTGTEVLLVDDTTGAGGGVNSNYRDFRIYGNRAALSTVVAGLKLYGNALYLNFTNLRINECKGSGIVCDGKTGPTRRPTLVSWSNISVSSGDSHGLEMKAGRHMKFTEFAAELMGGRAIYISGVTEQVSKIIFDTPYLEAITGDGIRFEEVDQSEVLYPLVNGYGTTGAASYGFIITGIGNASRCKLVGGDFVKNAAPHANSRHIRIDAGDSYILENLNIATTDIQFVGTRSIVINGSLNTIAFSVAPLIFTNGRAALGTNTTRYLAPNTGGQDATQSNVRGMASGYMTLAGMRAETTTLPGGTDSYAIALFVNGIATAMTASLTNAGGGIDISGAEVLVLPGDTFSVRVISSATAASLPQDGLHITIGVKA